ncbi:MAG TPA: class I SAM-dependent methyltransferase [Bacteroidetes bacterium]|nr:class I SAM-dependent methyltransferase [Bacteroidota bacterium]
MKYLQKSFDYLQPEIAEAYDEVSFWSAPFGLLLLREIPLISKGMALDLGCATGFPLLTLAQRLGPDVRVMGLDPWLAAIERAHRKATAFEIRNVELHHGTTADIPFDDEDFDLVVSNLGINNFENPSQAFDEVNRVLKMKGRLCLTTNPIGTFARFYEVMLETLAEVGQEKAIFELSKHISARRTRSQLEDLFYEAELDLERVVEETHIMRYANGTAFLNDYFIILGFLPGWKDIVKGQLQEKIFKLIEEKLNAIAKKEGELRMEVPMLYMEGKK